MSARFGVDSDVADEVGCGLERRVEQVAVAVDAVAVVEAVRHVWVGSDR